MADIELERDGGVAIIRLNRPHRKNAFTFEMIDLWAVALREAAADESVGSIVVTGAGEAFCAGVDLEHLYAHGDTPLDYKKLIGERVHQVAHAIGDIDIPVVAAINGVAVGAGLDMALMCDMRFAAQSARMSESYVRLGLVPGDGGCYYLPRLVGRAKALELLLSGDFVDAQEAHRIGMVNRVYDDAELLTATMDFAARLAHGSREARRMIKRTVYASESMDMRTSLDLISSHMAIAMSTDEARAAVEDARARLSSRG